MSCHFICLTRQPHRTRMISIIKWHLTIKHPKRISSEPHILPFKFATDAFILHIFEGYWAKYTSWMEVLERYMPSWRVKIEFEMVRGLREGRALIFRSTFCKKKPLPADWVFMNSCSKKLDPKTNHFLTKTDFKNTRFENQRIQLVEIWKSKNTVGNMCKEYNWSRFENQRIQLVTRASNRIWIQLKLSFERYHNIFIHNFRNLLYSEYNCTE